MASSERPPPSVGAAPERLQRQQTLGDMGRSRPVGPGRPRTSKPAPFKRSTTINLAGGASLQDLKQTRAPARAPRLGGNRLLLVQNQHVAARLADLHQAHLPTELFAFGPGLALATDLPEPLHQPQVVAASRRQVSHANPRIRSSESSSSSTPSKHQPETSFVCLRKARRPRSILRARAPLSRPPGTVEPNLIDCQRPVHIEAPSGGSSPLLEPHPACLSSRHGASSNLARLRASLPVGLAHLSKRTKLPASSISKIEIK